jgi:hypothetical protein
MNVDSQKIILAPGASKLMAVSLTDGKSMWSMDYTQGRYNAASPVVDGQTVYISGPNRGITALDFAVDGDKIVSKQKWRNEDTETTTMFNTPVLLRGHLFGLSTANQLFCVQTDCGKMTWNEALASAAPATPQARGGGGAGSDRGGSSGARGDRGNRGGDAGRGGSGQQRGEGSQRSGEGRPQGGFGGRSRGGRGGGRRGGGSRGGYGSVVSAGKALLGLTPSSELIVYEPNGDEVKELAKYKVSEKKTYAYPIPIGNRIYVKDDDSLTLWTLK